TPQGLEVIGYGQKTSHGVRKGVIVNIDSTVQALKEAVAEASQLSGRQADYIVTGVTGAHIQTLQSHGMVPIRDQEVKAQDIQKAVEEASAITLPLYREVSQSVPHNYIIDGQEGIQEPLGMFGQRLEVDVQIVSGFVTPLESIRRCL